ncbi:MAG: hypothetical protein RMN52_06675 [Anaerolineae bacterium]|nr:hypothetical protein [Candidatus Roseilinea sp.]MDW8449671.1 hypothetical protein [Anaerolineae bacterium]
MPRFAEAAAFAPLVRVALFAAMIAAAIAHLYPTMIAPLNIYDEGIIVYGATRVMHGEIPYRDFWTQYSPGQLYALAGLFRVFGVQIAVERWWDVAIRALLAFVMFLLAGQLTSRSAALVAWLIGALWVTYYGFFGYPIFAGLLFSLFSIYALLRAMASNAAANRPAGVGLDRRWLVAGGLALGLAALFRHDMAIYCAAAQMAIALPFIFVQRTPASRPIFERVVATVRAVLPFALGALALVAPAFIFFVVSASPAELIRQLFIFPLTEFPKVRDLPYPKLDWSVDNVQFYAPFLVYPLAVMSAVLRARSDADARAQAWGVAMVVLFGAFGFNQARVRSDTIHTVHFFLCAVVLLPVLLRGFPATAQVPSAIVASVGAVLSVAAIVNPIAGYIGVIESRPAAEREQRMTLPIGLPGRSFAQQTMAVATLQRLTAPDERIYVGLARHDRVFANDAMFYFLAQRPSATRYHELHPGVTNTLPVQQEMVADLERHQVRYVVLTDMFEGANEPNDSARSTGVTLLDEYLAERYRTANVIGPYRILVRRP